jgi:hypothetical protein
MVKHIKKSYSKDGKLTPEEKKIAYATAWKNYNRANEEVEQIDEVNIKDFKEKHVQGLYHYRHFQHPNGSWIQVHVKNKKNIVHSDGKGNHTKFDNFNDLKKHVESLKEDIDLSEFVISTKFRKHLKKKKFGLPGKEAYPMPDKEHAANAKARATQELKKGKLTAAEAAKIRKKADRILGEEQLDEISKELATNYLKKSIKDQTERRDGQYYTGDRPNKFTSKLQIAKRYGTPAEVETEKRKIKNREKGIDRAFKRINSEEVQIDETNANNDNKAKPSHEDVHLDVAHVFENAHKYEGHIRGGGPGNFPATKHWDASPRDHVVHTTSRGFHDELKNLIHQHGGDKALNDFNKTGSATVHTREGIKHHFQSLYGSHHNVYTHVASGTLKEERLDEISNDKLKSYGRAAMKSVDNLHHKSDSLASISYTKGVVSNKETLGKSLETKAKAEVRKNYIRKAAARINPGAARDNNSFNKYASHWHTSTNTKTLGNQYKRWAGVSEEQLDEISRDTITRYIPKSRLSKTHHERMADAHDEASYAFRGVHEPAEKKHQELAKKHDSIAKKRERGMDMAANKLSQQKPPSDLLKRIKAYMKEELNESLRKGRLRKIRHENGEIVNDPHAINIKKDKE